MDLLIEKKNNLKKSTLDLYSRVLNKLNITCISDLTGLDSDGNSKHDIIISRINDLSSNSYKIMAYRAINQIIDDPIYNKQYRELHNNIDRDNIGELPMTLSELLSIEVKCSNELQQVVESFTIYINTHYPLRLDYYNVVINPAEKENHINYMTYYEGVLTFYLNDFKNVRSFGSQVLTYSDPVICSYLTYLTSYFGYLPDFLLYRYDKVSKSLAVFSSRIYYGEYLSNLLKKHTGKDISMNTIRKIHESDLIQSPEYSKMSNQEKKNKHNRLLHSLQTAHESYNIINSNV